MVDLQGMQPPSAEPSSSAYPHLVPSALPDPVPSRRDSHAVPAPSTGPVPLESDEIAQPEQELTPLVSAAPSVSEAIPEGPNDTLDLPAPEDVPLEEGLSVTHSISS